jgi:hypothetical protein
VVDGMIKTVRDLKAFLENVDDDATIVLNVEDKESGDTYIAMDDETKADWDSSVNVLILKGKYTDTVNM